jgi:uncharacterized protein
VGRIAFRGGVAAILRAVSAENVQVVRSIYEAWAKGGSARPYLADDMEYVNPTYAVESGTRRGPASFRLVGDFWERVRVDVEELIDAGDDVVVIATFRATGAGSGVNTETRQGYVWTIQDGKAVRFQWFNSAEEAKAAAGLPRP